MRQGAMQGVVSRVDLRMLPAPSETKHGFPSIFPAHGWTQLEQHTVGTNRATRG